MLPALHMYVARLIEAVAIIRNQRANERLTPTLRSANIRLGQATGRR